MSQQIINIGSAPNDGTGDQLRTAFDKSNDNFTELYQGAGNTSAGLWNFNQTSTDISTAPVSGRFKTNSGNYHDATQIAIHGTTIQGIDRADRLRTLLVGDIVQCQDSLNDNAWCRYVLQSAAVDNGSWFQLDVALDTDGGVASGDNQEVIFNFTANTSASGGGGNVSNVGTPTNGQLAQWTDATHIQGIDASVLGYAPLASPTFTGDPKAPTPTTGDNDTSIATTAFVTNAIREKVTAARNYYVSTTGNDSNDGRTTGTAFLTIQKAIDVVSTTLDIVDVNVTINVADGTYTGDMVLRSCVGARGVIIVGNEAAPINCIIAVTNGFPVNAARIRTLYQIRGFHLKALTAGYSCVIATNGSHINLRNIRFEGSKHISATYAAQVSLSATISVTGNFDIHIYADTKAIVSEFGQTITIVGTPAITQGWAFLIQDAMLISNGNAYNGSCTGPRYYAASMSYIYTGTNGSATYFPGDAAGSSATGAIYD